LAKFNPKTKSQIYQIHTRKKKFQKILNFFVENSEILPGKKTLGGVGVQFFLFFWCWLAGWLYITKNRNFKLKVQTKIECILRFLIATIQNKISEIVPNLYTWLM